MTRPPDDSTTPPDAPAGLADPRTIHPGPEMFGAGGDAATSSGRPEALDAGSPRHDEGDDPDAGEVGLVDPRSEVADPTGP